jgi:hypothetical protein
MIQIEENSSNENEAEGMKYERLAIFLLILFNERLHEFSPYSIRMFASIKHKKNIFFRFKVIILK